MDERTHARYMSDIAYFLSKMEAEPNSGYFIPIALAYNKLEKYDETIAMCKSAIERFPANCAAKTFLAEAYVYKGQFDLARELLFDVTAEDDNNYKALKLLGIICKENGDTSDALKYLTGAYIRSPEDGEVRKMIEELGGSLNPAQIYDERMKRQSQAAVDSEEDEEIRTYQEIDNRIRSAEIIMADLVSDTSISARDYSEEEEYHSDDPNDFMPLITKHSEAGEDEEELSDDPNDFLPTITPYEHNQDENDDNQEEQNIDNNISADDSKSLSALEGEDDLLSALADDNNSAGEDDLLSALADDDNSAGEDDLLSALAGDDNSAGEDDLLAALKSDENHQKESLFDTLQEVSDSTDSGDLLSELSADKDSIFSAEQNGDNSINEADAEISELDAADIDNKEVYSNHQDTLLEENAEELLENDEAVKSAAKEAEEIANPAPEEELTEEEKKVRELYNRKIPSSVVDMTYDDMIDDDFQYGKIVDENYSEVDAPSVDLGESAPFTQGDIMDEILGAVGMTQEDMTNDEEIEFSDKEKTLEKLEQFLEKVRTNKENV